LMLCPLSLPKTDKSLSMHYRRIQPSTMQLALPIWQAIVDRIRSIPLTLGVHASVPLFA
jgi:hypothetical protein